MQAMLNEFVDKVPIACKWINKDNDCRCDERDMNPIGSTNINHINACFDLELWIAKAVEQTHVSLEELTNIINHIKRWPWNTPAL